MAAAKIKPVSSGSFTTYTGKATTGMPAPPGLAHQATRAVSLFAFAQGAYGTTNTLTTRANKIAAAAGISLQYS